MSAAVFPAAAPSRSRRQLPALLNVTSHLDPSFGGIAKVLPELCAAVAETDECAVSLVAFCDPAEKKAVPYSSRVPVECIQSSRFSRVSGSAPDRFIEKVRQSEAAHIHGIWEQHCTATAHTARDLHKPYVLSAHGMLEPWALRNKRWKKAVYSFFTERDNVRNASCLHALTQAEAENYRQFGAKNPIVVIPNGVRAPAGVTSELFLSRYPSLIQRRPVLFLGRIHYKKGLDLLVKAWQTVAEADKDAHLVLAGPDSEGTQASIEAAIAQTGLADRITFTGMLTGDLKWSALKASELFVLPSYSEGFSVSVLEAMCMGKPVVVTRQCNVPEVEQHDCGWQIDPDAEQLAAAIAEYLRAPERRARELGMNGMRLTERSYNWTSIGARMRAVYEWLMGGSVPCSVDMRLT